MYSLILFSLVACQYGLTLPSSEKSEADGTAKPMKMKARERTPILPGFLSGPPPPEPGITSGQCNDMSDGGPLNIDDCITDEIECGETVVGHTIGGINRFDTRFYEKNFCTPATTNHDSGDERVYRLSVPEGNHTAVVTLDSPCADLDMAAFRYKGDTCPSSATIIHHCDMWPTDGTGRERVQLASQHATNWYIVVEGKDDYEGAFSLTVQCRNSLQ